MNIEINGVPPNTYIRLEPENQAERLQIALLREQALEPKRRVDLLVGRGENCSAILLRLEDQRDAQRPGVPPLSDPKA